MDIGTRLSVILPVYNASRFVASSIESVLAQTYSEFELIIINDGSTDNSREIILEFKDPRIVFIDREDNRGLIDTLNQGIETAQGDVIARIDADDLCMPLRFEKQMAWLDEHPEVGVIGSNIQLIDANESPGMIIVFPERSAQINWAMYFYSALAHPSTMIRKRVFDAIGRYRSTDSSGLDLFSVEDYDLWFRALNVTELHNLQDPLTLLRKHDDNITRTNLERHIENALQLSHKMITHILGEDVSIAEIRRLRSIRDKREIISSQNISLYLTLLEMYFLKQKVLHSDEKLVRYDASNMLLEAWRYTETLRDTLNLLWTGFRISPSAAVNFARIKFPILIRKLVNSKNSAQGDSMPGTD